MSVILSLQVLLVMYYYLSQGNFQLAAARGYELMKSNIIQDSTTYVVNSRFYDPYVTYALVKNNIRAYKKYYYFSIKMSDDIITNADYIIIDKDIDETRYKKPIITNQFMNVYQN